MSTIAIISFRGERGSFFSTCLQPNPVELKDILAKHYNSAELAEELVLMGTSVTIAPKLAPYPDTPHTIENPQDGVSVFLHRDSRISACNVYDESELEDILEGFDTYYHYVFENNAWTLSTMKDGKKSAYKPIYKARLLFTSQKGYPIVHILNAPTSFRVHTDRKRDVKPINNGLAVSVDYWYRFVDINKDAFNLQYVSDIEVDERSVPYYGFDIGDGRSVYRARLTKGFIENFFNYYGSRLMRYEPNVTDATNVLGMRLAEFESVIIDSDSPMSVGEDATMEECIAIRSACHENSTAYRVITAHMETLGFSEEEKKNVLEEVEFYESEISEIFQKHKDAIEEFKKTLPERPFDCGFTTIYTVNCEMNKKYQQLVSMGKRNDCSVNVNFPSDYFGCSNSYKILEELRRLSGKDILNTITVRTILD